MDSSAKIMIGANTTGRIIKFDCNDLSRIDDKLLYGDDDYVYSLSMRLDVISNRIIICDDQELNIFDENLKMVYEMYHHDIIEIIPNENLITIGSLTGYLIFDMIKYKVIHKIDCYLNCMTKYDDNLIIAICEKNKAVMINLANNEIYNIGQTSSEIESILKLYNGYVFLGNDSCLSVGDFASSKNIDTDVKKIKKYSETSFYAMKTKSIVLWDEKGILLSFNSTRNFTDFCKTTTNNIATVSDTLIQLWDVRKTSLPILSNELMIVINKINCED